MEDKFKLLSVVLEAARLKYKESLRYHTFSRSSGFADCLYIATSQIELIKALNTAFELGIPLFVIGSGTKVLNENFPGLVIKNRSNGIKIASVKGKVGTRGIDVEEASIEADSGVTFEKLNQFLKGQNLLEFAYTDSEKATLGGSLNLNPNLMSITQKVKVWEDGEIEVLDITKLNLQKQFILGIVVKIKAKKV